MLYSDAEHDAVASACAEADAVIVRASTGAHTGVDMARLDAFLRELSGGGKTVMPDPHTVSKLGAKSCVSRLNDLKFGMSGTVVYNTPGELTEGLPGSLAGGARVLKANRGTQGTAVWLCTVDPTDGDAVTVQYAKDSSIETMSMADLTDKLVKVFTADVPDSESGYSTEATDPCYFVDQMYFPE